MKLTSEMTEKELRQETRRLEKNISRRMKNVQKELAKVGEGIVKGILSASISAYEKAKKLHSDRLNKLTQDEVKSLYRQLKYVESLKTSNAKYVAKQIKEYTKAKQGKSDSKRVNSYKTIEEKVKSWYKWGQKNKDKYNKILGRLQEHYGGLFQQYKYDIEEELTRRVNSRRGDIDSITQDIIDKIDKYYEEDLESEEWF